MIKFDNRSQSPAPSKPHASKPATAQLAALEDLANRGEQARHTAQLRETLDARGNRTGMPDALKSGLEQLSGRDLSSVRVHYDSPQPAQLSADAYTRGTEIHLAPGQEQHLPHEAGHVVQQMEGRVRPTTEASGVAINDDHALETEADALGAEAMRLGVSGVNANDAVQRRAMPAGGVAQLQINITGGSKPGSYTTMQAMNLLVGAGLITMKESNDIYDEIEKLDQANLTFDSLESMLAAAIKAYEGEGEEEDEDEEVEDFDEFPDLWQDEGAEFRKRNFKKEGFIRGESIRKDMDYETVDKDAYEVEGDPDLALVIRLNRVKHSQPLKAEVGMLTKIGVSVPAAEVIGTGFYPIKGVPYPAMLMTRYLSSSKTLARSAGKKGPERTENWKKAAEVFNTVEMVENGLSSLESIKLYVQANKKNAIDDIQFLIDRDGRFVINDASGQGKQENNIMLIDVLTDVLRERLAQLEG